MPRKKPALVAVQLLLMVARRTHNTDLSHQPKWEILSSVEKVWKILKSHGKVGFRDTRLILIFYVDKNTERMSKATSARLILYCEQAKCFTFWESAELHDQKTKKHNSILAQKTEETDSILQFTTKLLLDRFLDRCIKVWVVCICAHPQHKAVVLRSHFAAKYLKYCDRKLDKTAASFFSSVNCSCSCCECTANALTRDRVETRSVACIRFIVNQRNVGKHCCNLQCIGAMELQSTVVVRTYSFKLDFPSLCSRIYFQQPLKIILFVIPEWNWFWSRYAKSGKYGRYICAILSEAVVIFGLCTDRNRTHEHCACAVRSVLSKLWP